jgi:hypothetical protein
MSAAGQYCEDEMLKWLFGSDSETKITQLLERGNIGYLSASCCNPSAASADQQLESNLRQALTNLELPLEIHKETLTGAQASMRSAMGQFGIKQGAIAAKVMSLFSTRGLEAFPCVFIDGDLAFHSGVPSTEAIEEYLRAHLDHLTPKGSEAEAGQSAKGA